VIGGGAVSFSLIGVDGGVVAGGMSSTCVVCGVTEILGVVFVVDDSALRVLGPTLPYPVVLGVPDDTMLLLL